MRAGLLNAYGLKSKNVARLPRSHSLVTMSNVTNYGSKTPPKRASGAVSNI
jgi:hypothetical protein